MSNITSIELGSEKISCTIASVDDQNNKQLRILGFASVPSRGIKRAQIVDIQEVTKALEECLNQVERMAGTRINEAILITSGPNIASQTSHGIVAVNYQNQDISPDDIVRVIESAKAISLASNREIIHVIPTQYIVDGQSNIKNPVGMNGVRLEVDTHIVSASSINLNNIRKICSLLGVSVRSFVFGGLASAQAVLSDTEKELGCILVDIGSGTSDVCVYIDGAVAHTAVIPLGSKNVTSDIAAGLRISLDSAEKVKLYLSNREGGNLPLGKGGIKIKKIETSSSDELSLDSLHLPEKIDVISQKILVDGIIKPRIEEIAQYVRQELSSLDFKSQTPAGVILTGGGALTPYICAMIKKELRLPVRVGYPAELEGVADELKDPRYSAIVGALLYSGSQESDPPKMQIPDFGKLFKNFELKDNLKKTVDFFKSFIPGTK
ncbi:cell division protein FtsA [Candidatus Roizmanbacteria bacterium RIFOXYB2_FULL_41_10]|uniref:Cell division protein FtsA n=1 Tax=Candidatus Roizmanbacteria bacterium RIFOXYA1_FULL_41_12 TaxID=1802082 RepID=A0A1F7K271_9BACT|nr:MAG: cell division protein FtsA [Candidatus Roizmanbacteria bacterium RIFOXYA1_FULL_41_12]OGK66607.1 MAG: cell division protein FtsA [Candidatus Roizmanbacteria bacterium RIFOXYB1_FULL_41_27]OGK67146.1 MAG: cell division protein FtsA [Candidatus Roizmanbacteria bacterium RIFOXYA2_FULL_41_8]OGK69255.1 MAG: cell division protein FtsA [Candidatus Roizmanbacteria bacterium RIFOXYB2_FULL_41_10]OGK71003.1 MAG: cell division protein FtsA [Candidatus Roizmanbacteria bacterium RIFOXYC1_FULL_41_16]OG